MLITYFQVEAQLDSTSSGVVVVMVVLRGICSWLWAEMSTMENWIENSTKVGEGDKMGVEF